MLESSVNDGGKLETYSTEGETMAYEADAVRYIVEWLEMNAQHAVDVVVGPKREEWFNAESIVALWRHSDIDRFVVFGEQNYREALKETPFRDALDPTHNLKIPDIVAYTPSDDKYNVPFIVEAKVLYRTEPKNDRKASLTKLREQLLRAKQICPNTGTVGLVYLVSVVDGLGVSPQPFFAEVHGQIKDVFAGKNITWLREPCALKGLQLRSTSFAYPATTVSLGGRRVLPLNVTNRRRTMSYWT